MWAQPWLDIRSDIDERSRKASNREAEQSRNSIPCGTRRAEPQPVACGGMLDLSVFEVLVLVLLYVVIPALVLFAVYWVTRLAVRHERRRSAGERVNQVP